MHWRSGVARRDFIIGALCGGERVREIEPAPGPSCDGASLARTHRRGGLVDLTALVRDALARLRALSSPGERALLLVRLLPELPVDARSQVALAVATHLAPFELRRIGRAGLLALEAACAFLEPEWRESAQRLLAPALEARPRATRRVVGEALLCAEGLDRELVARAILGLRDRPCGGVVFVAATGEQLPLEAWSELLSAEARLGDDAQLARFAALARAGQCRLTAEKALEAPPPLLRRALGALAAWWEREAYGEAAPPASRSVLAPPTWG